MGGKYGADAFPFGGKCWVVPCKMVYRLGRGVAETASVICKSTGVLKAIGGPSSSSTEGVEVAPVLVRKVGSGLLSNVAIQLGKVLALPTGVSGSGGACTGGGLPSIGPGGLEWALPAPGSPAGSLGQ